jgi:small subunit ribosomal protein S21
MRLSVHLTGIRGRQVREGVSRNMRVDMRDNESFDGLLRRFTKEVQKSGKLRDFRSKRRFVSKSEQRRAKIRKAEHKRRRKAAQGPGF